MNCIVTAGPTYEPLDEVRRLINFSTGRLGSELGNYLVDRGHHVTLLLGQQATWKGNARSQEIIPFGATQDLRARLAGLAARPVDAVFHAAAVSDFSFGKIWRQLADGKLEPVQGRKISSRSAPLLAELAPTVKIIAELRAWFPHACLVGWKYELDGSRASAITEAEAQMAACRTNACVANGPAYGDGFGLVAGPGQSRHLEDATRLFAALEELMRVEA
jgi:phosphopantothenoylcysteine synthetase/decarboxylase